MERDLTSGSVFQTVIRFSLPFFLSYFLQTLYGMADLFIIGQFCGVESTTAVSIGSQVMHMLTVMIVGLSMGATVLIGQAMGGRRPERAAHLVGNTATLFLLLSLALTAGLLLAVGPIVSVMSTPAEAAAGTRAYLTVCFLGVPFITAYNVISAILRGMGDSKSPMYFVAIACVCNIALDYLFIGGCHLGPAGAALGTTLSQTASVLISLTALARRGLGVPLTREDFKLRGQTAGELLRIGAPVALQEGFIQISFLVITVLANLRGLNDAAAVGIVEKLIGVMFLIPSSMLSTVSSLAAQSIGAGKHRRARQVMGYAMLLAVIWGVVAILAMQLAAEPFVGLFVDREKAGSREVIRLEGEYMRGYVWDCLFAGLTFSFSGYFCAYGLSMVPFLHNIVAILLVRLPVAWWASWSFQDTLFPMGLASPLGSLLSLLICAGIFVWLKRRQDTQKGG